MLVERTALQSSCERYSAIGGITSGYFGKTEDCRVVTSDCPNSLSEIVTGFISGQVLTLTSSGDVTEKISSAVSSLS